MIRTISWFTGLLVFAAAAPGPQARAAAPTPNFEEVYQLLRSHLAGVSEGQLNEAAVQGLLASLGPKVTLVDSKSAESTPAGTALVTKSSRLEGDMGYIRVARVEQGLAQAVREAYNKLQGTNQLQGLVLDLRYARGGDYAAAAATADLFVNKPKPLLDWGKGMVKSQEKAHALDLPVAVMVNQQTAAAAEALAAALRETGAGLLLGGRTAGQAMLCQEFPLQDGQWLRIATTPVRLGNGTALSAKGVQPDIPVEVSAKDERAYYTNAFQTASQARAGLSSTNTPGATNQVAARPRFNEAELVRERKQSLGDAVDTLAPAPKIPQEGPQVQDPTLARALDVLKGLAVVRHARS